MDYTLLRKKMVEQQLIGRGIKSSKVIQTFLKVERHKFVPAQLRNSAYADRPVPIGNGQTISQPYIVALMTESLDLSKEQRVLEIGTGSGYQTAILAELSDQVYSIERLPELANASKELLAGLNYSNIQIKSADGTLGYPEEAPFSRIIITAATPQTPLPLIEQLAEGGKMVLPLGETFTQVLTLIAKSNGQLKKETICSCVFVPLIGKYGFSDT
ncbi:MAG: protein-L-isoaspartate(D-aspartate) O-methyltransferase [Candidatus Omnitrophota bacterium]